LMELELVKIFVCHDISKNGCGHNIGILREQKKESPHIMYKKPGYATRSKS